jgi:esterase
LFLHGGASDYVLAAHHRAIQQLFPAATIRALPDAGHWLHAEQPQAVCQALEDFLG